MSKELEKEVTALKNYIIGQAIRKNEVFNTRLLSPDVMLEKLSKRFAVEMNDTIPMIRNVDGLMSHENPARSATTDEAITQLLTSTFKGDLLPEQENKTSTPDQGNKKPIQQQNPQVPGLLAKYQEAKTRVDGPSMISIKRRLQQAGHVIL